MKVSIIIPCYNEKNTLPEILKKIENVKLDGVGKEVVLIDDGSDDGTKQILSNLFPKLKARVLFHEKNLGKGASIKTGLKHASGDIIIIQDADLEYDPKDYRLLLEPIIAGRADVVYGSRFVSYRPDGLWAFWHFLVNKSLTLFSNILSGLRLSDMETCYKAFKSGITKGISLKENGFGFEPEFTMKIAKRRYRICEAAISYYGRDYKQGKKITWKDGLWACWCLVKYRFSD